MEPSDNHHSAKLQYLIELIESILPFTNWGFTQKTKFAGSPSSKTHVIYEGEILPYTIYNSEYCRVKFSLDYSGYGRSPGLWIYYGRLHAPDSEIYMKWNGNDCYCWHKFGLALQYLDGMSPKKAAETQGEEPRGIQEFSRLELTTNTISQPEWMTRMHATVWEYYGLRLFQLFDLRHLELWSQYTKFVKEYYDIIGRNPAHKPSLDKIC